MIFGYFWCFFCNFENAFCAKKYSILGFLQYIYICLAAEGDTADRESVAPVVVVRGVDAA